MANEWEKTTAFALRFQAPDLRAILKPEVAELQAWQSLLARVKKLTRFDAKSLELIAHDVEHGTISAVQRLSVSLRIGQERIAGGLPSGVAIVKDDSDLKAHLVRQLAACETEVGNRLETWRAGNDNYVATPDSARFLQGSKPLGYSYNCRKCHGRGKNDCTSCQASGRLTCSGCNGRGQMTCFSCSGHGNVRCNNCNGSGLQQGGHHTCISCNGRGTNMCLSCAGSRTITCSGCGGRREVSCGSCSGSGAIGCTPCAGSGTISEIGRIGCTVSVSDKVGISCNDEALTELCGRFSTIASAGQHAKLTIEDSKVDGAHLTSRIGGRFIADRLRLRVGGESLDLYGMRHSGTILDYRNIIGRLLDADVDRLGAAADAPLRLALTPSLELVDALSAVLESEAVSLTLRGKALRDADGTLMGRDFAERVRAVVGKVLRRIHWQTMALSILVALLLPIIGYKLIWQLPGEKNLNQIGITILLGPMALGLAVDWWLRRRLLARMGPVARPALQRLLSALGHVRRGQLAIAVAALLGTVFAMRIWLF